MRSPGSTYRLQLTPEFGFAAAAELVPYLAELGVGSIYLSPILESDGSAHGYDVVDTTRVDSARGGREEFVRLAEAAHAANLGVVVDIVPNHMGVAVPRRNAWWWDVLQHGPDAEHAGFFDIDWASGDGRLLIPVVGDDDLPAEDDDPIGHITVDVDAGLLRYHDTEYPLAPGTGHGSIRETLDTQHYRLIHWREGDRTLNYRRFFTVTTLAGLRIEDEGVWEASHAEILSWVREGLVDGLRIDHPDGLRDPAGYLQRLRERTAEEAPDGEPLWVSVEKILEPGEQLGDWACEGTTGYDASAEIDRILVDPEGRDDLDDLAASLSTDDLDDWPTLVHTAKRFVADQQLAAEIARIVRDLGPIPVDAEQAADAVAEIAACFPVYRTYLPFGEDVLAHAAERAADWRTDLLPALEAIVPLLADPEHPAARRFQQTTGMIMAKAVEDRVFYRYSRLTSLNEVGADPSRFAIPLDGFHALQARRLLQHPLGQTGLSTHDSKRSEGVRARIHVLSEMPGEWAEALEPLLEAAPIRNRSFGNLLWQAIVGAWPATPDRLVDYAVKAAREAGDVTSWTDVDASYEAELVAAVDAAFSHPVAKTVLQRLDDRLLVAARSNGLVMKAIQLMIPGVPDVYQGTELWFRALVDPDNRRPVDWSARRAALSAILAGARPGIDDSGAAKLHLVATVLRLRRDRPELFTGYAPIEATGPSAGHVVAFDRGGVALVGTRLPLGLADRGGWLGTRVHLPEGEWEDALRGTRVSGAFDVAALLTDLPVAILVQR